jgi:hypothetical protein
LLHNHDIRYGNDIDPYTTPVTPSSNSEGMSPYLDAVRSANDQTLTVNDAMIGNREKETALWTDIPIVHVCLTLYVATFEAPTKKAPNWTSEDDNSQEKETIV